MPMTRPTRNATRTAPRCARRVHRALCRVIVSVARRLMTVTASASDKRISGFSDGEDVILDDDRAINRLSLTVIKQRYVVNCYKCMVEKTLY